MKKQIAIVLLSIATAFTGSLPANAFPSMPVSGTVETVNKPILVRDSIGDISRETRRFQRGDGARDQRWRNYRGNRWDRGDRYYRSDRYDRRYYRDGYYRDRYRNRSSNAGAIIGGLAAGALIGGALAAPTYSSPRRYLGGDAHTNWCYSRYRSYRASDNTYVPRAGVRAECISPY